MTTEVRCDHCGKLIKRLFRTDKGFYDACCDEHCDILDEKGITRVAGPFDDLRYYY